MESRRRTPKQRQTRVFLRKIKREKRRRNRKEKRKERKKRKRTEKGNEDSLPLNKKETKDEANEGNEE